MSEDQARKSPDRRTATLVGLFNQYASVGLSVIQGIVLVPTYLRHIDERTYGAWLASGNIIAWLAFIDPGVSGVIQQRIGVAYGKKDYDVLSVHVGTGLVVNLAFGLAVGALGLAVSPWVPGLAALDASVAPAIVRNFALASVSEAVLLWALSINSVVVALLARPLAVGLSYQGSTLLGIGATVLLLRAGYGLASIPLGLLVRAAVMLLGAVALLVETLWTLRVRPRFARAELKAIFALSGFTWLSRLGANVLQNVDGVLVSRSLGAERVPTLTLTRRAADLLLQVTARFTAAFVPALSHIHGEGDLGAQRQVSLRLLRVVSWISVLALGGYVAFNPAFMHLWVGSRFYGGLGLTVLVGLALLWQSVASVLSQTLFAVGGIRQTGLITFAESVLKVALIATLLHLGVGLSSAPLGPLMAALGFSVFTLGRAWLKAMGLSAREGGALFLEVCAQTVPVLGLAALFNRYAPLARTVPVFVAQSGAFALAVLAFLWAVSGSFRDEVRPLARRLLRRR